MEHDNSNYKLGFIKAKIVLHQALVNKYKTLQDLKEKSRSKLEKRILSEKIKTLVELSSEILSI